MYMRKSLMYGRSPSPCFWQIKIADGLTARRGSLYAGYRLTVHGRAAGAGRVTVRNLL